jgi:hypothetical protein
MLFKKFQGAIFSLCNAPYLGSFGREMSFEGILFRSFGKNGGKGK